MINQILTGDCLEILKSLPDNSVDSFVTDPPAGINFMGKEWDSNKGGRKEWIAWLTLVMEEVYRALKPGAYGLVWALPRTSHWTATALEDAGFTVRDCLVHHFGSGFPKNLDISKQLDKTAKADREVVSSYETHDIRNGQGREYGGGMYAGEKTGSITVVKTKPATDLAKQYDGFGTALKPSSEFWWLVQKPIERKLTISANVAKWGTGGLNIGACRVESNSNLGRPVGKSSIWGNGNLTTNEFMDNSNGNRWPSNLLLSHSLFCLPENCSPDCPIAAMDRMSGESESQKPKLQKMKGSNGNDYGKYNSNNIAIYGHGDSGGASRFFPNFSYSKEELDEMYFMFRYFAKPSQAERNEGLESLPERVKVYNGQSGNSSKEVKPVEERFTTVARNVHPTVKSQALMSWLCKLATPPNGVILDPFAGSGSTLVAAYKADFNYIGIEKEELYCEIARLRVEAAKGLFKFTEQAV